MTTFMNSVGPRGQICSAFTQGNLVLSKLTQVHVL